MLKGLSGKELTADEEAHIQDLQDEIDEIWSRRGDYKIDEDAWKKMPIFMEEITEEDVAQNEAVQALSSIVYDGCPAEEIALNRKEQGNKALQMALNPEQVNRDNMARAAYHCYTEGIQAHGNDRRLNAQLYANRSLAHFIIKNFGHGLADGQKAVLMDPEYAKGYFRAAKCAERLQKYDIALNLLSKAKQLVPPLEGDTLKEVNDLETLCLTRKDQMNAKIKRDSQKTRATAAETANIMRAITTHGIKIGDLPEVTSEQMQQYGRHKPYFDVEGILHVPILFIYDEYSQTDYMQDVGGDVSVVELIDELMPFPWDDRGRYAKLDDVVVVYKIDDGVKMPEYYEVDQAWPLLEVFRSETYQMPKLQPVLHVVAKDSEFLERWGLRK
jgi:tetratricopeptide (TPR) repeat protein